MRVLIVDDYPLWASLLSSMLTLRGFCVQVAKSYEEALHVLYQQKFDAFVVDVRLVDYDAQNRAGLEFVNHVQDLYASAQVLILSGWPAQLRVAIERFGNRDNILILDKIDSEKIEAAFDNLSSRLTM
jgi:two-component system, response regulator RegA